MGVRSKYIPSGRSQVRPEIDIAHLKRQLETISKQLSGHAIPNYDEVRSKLLFIAKTLEEVDANPRAMQRCLMLMVNLELKFSNFKSIMEPAAKLVKSFGGVRPCLPQG